MLAAAPASLPPPTAGGHEAARPLSILTHLASANSLSSLRRASIPSGPYTLLTLPAEWVARILSFLSPDCKLTEVCHVSSALHRSVVSLSSSFRDDFISFSSSRLPPLLVASPWFRGVSGVKVRGSGPDPFQLDQSAEDGGSAQQNTSEIAEEGSESSNETPSAADGSPVSSITSSPHHYASSPVTSSSSPLSSPFSSIRSLSISLSLDSSSPSPAARSPPSTMLSSLSGWSNLRHLVIVADDTEDWFTAANLNSGLLTAQNFTPFLLLTHLRSLTLDATVKAEQVTVLVGMESLQCLLLTEREQRAGVDEARWQREEADMMSALSAVSRLVRRGRGLVQLRMPPFHFSVSADEFCERLGEEQADANTSPMSCLSVQGTLSRRGVSALATLPELTSLTLAWGCELDADDKTLASLPQCSSLQHLHVRLSDLLEQDENDEESYAQQLPALSHVLSVISLTSLSLQLPMSGWTAQQSLALSKLVHLRRLTIAGEASGIKARHPLTHDILLPLITADENGKRPLQHLHSLTLDWLPLLDDAVLVISQLTELTSLSLLNCPYVSSALFYALTALPSLVKLKVYRCDVNLTARGWRNAREVLHYFTRVLPAGCCPLMQDQPRFPCLQVLECHLVHRLSCDVDEAGFAHFLSLLSPRHLHTFDFDSDYSTLPLFLQLSAFPHLRSLGSLSVDVSPLDTERVLLAKRSMSRVVACYYDRQYTRIERGERSRWRSRRRSSAAPLDYVAPTSDKNELWVRSREAEAEDDEDEHVLHEEGDDEMDAEEHVSSSSAQWRDREERRWTQPQGVQFRHQEARNAFFDRLAAVDKVEQQTTAAGRASQSAIAADEGTVQRKVAVMAAVANETDSEEEEESGSGTAEEERVDESPRHADEEMAAGVQVNDDDVEGEEAWEDDGEGGGEQQLEEDGMGTDEECDEQSEDDYAEWEWSGSKHASSTSSASLSVSLVGRSSKLHSRRYKRDEKVAIRLKASLPHTIDKSVRRGSSGDGVRLAGVAGQRKWEYAVAVR